VSNENGFKITPTKKFIHLKEDLSNSTVPKESILDILA